MIQTLVENAVKHGISKRVKGGEILIQSRLRENRLQIRIDNSGSLLSPGADGFGILNTQQRLDLIYNKNAAFEIKQTGPDTVSAILTIPIQAK
jgi:LytS/YehU family sensor histidine kinase